MGLLHFHQEKYLSFQKRRKVFKLYIFPFFLELVFQLCFVRKDHSTTEFFSLHFIQPKIPYSFYKESVKEREIVKSLSDLVVITLVTCSSPCSYGDTSSVEVIVIGGARCSGLRQTVVSFLGGQWKPFTEVKAGSRAVARTSKQISCVCDCLVSISL